MKKSNQKLDDKVDYRMVGRRRKINRIVDDLPCVLNTAI